MPAASFGLKPPVSQPWSIAIGAVPETGGVPDQGVSSNSVW